MPFSLSGRHRLKIINVRVVVWLHVQIRPVHMYMFFQQPFCAHSIFVILWLPGFAGVAMEIQDSLFVNVLAGVTATTDEGKAFDGAQVWLQDSTERLRQGFRKI